ncbi:restriction endonuclease subunit S [Micromonospora peucetia]|uniref:Restriction endonuclease subunit S n=1 Tax=Micromonospora peucetia TaxID=47871 RepID=A0A1C6UYM4_9ACTN|nr:restriction endonuclease subunit S [Micromonospora peucetia]MCX4387750.1 restriction endonuclease subunit S [Micromonospora peucetia]WSA35065.1 restriction endonuclease subunit S [Micromonospora peucetia]SCL59158.1 type I restriction enzyme, S subunit [Micromonospora peucetia]
MSQIRTARLADLVKFVGGGTPTRNNPDYYGGDIPWVTPKDMKSWSIERAQVNITDAGLSGSAARLVPAGSVLVVVRSGVLKHTLPVGVSRVPVAINQDMKAMLCGSEVAPDYLARTIKAHSSLILSWVRATTADNFPVEKLKEMRIPLPPIEEQRRIAGVLDRADELRAKRREALAHLDDLALGFFLDLFGSPDTNPQGWPLISLTDVLAMPLRNGISPATRGEVEGHVLTLSSITGRRFDPTARKSAAFLAPHSTAQVVHTSDFLMCRGNGNLGLVGRGFFPSVAMPDTAFPDTIIAARVRTELVRPVFLEHVWRSTAVRRQIESSARTTNGTYKVNQQGLGGISFFSPPLELQDRFTARIAAVDALRANHSSGLAELDALFASLQDRAFRGLL